jgi:ubiquinone/menaquinone biosynthesis C-methylase UbiE
VLEVGTGDGATLLALRSIGVSRVVSVELDLGRLAATKAKLRAPIPAEVHLVNANAIDLLSSTRLSERFSIVCSVYTLHNFPFSMKEQLLSGVFRCLVPGGVFINGDKMRGSRMVDYWLALVSQIFRFAVIGVSQRSIAQASYWIGHYLLDEMPARCISESELLHLCSRAGFSDVWTGMRTGMDCLMFARK